MGVSTCFCTTDTTQSLQQSVTLGGLFDNCSASSNATRLFEGLVPSVYDDFMSTWFYLLVCILLLIAAQFTAYACVTAKRHVTLRAVEVEACRKFSECQELLEEANAGAEADLELGANAHGMNFSVGDGESSEDQNDTNCSSQCFDCWARCKVKLRGSANIMLYAILERLLVPAVNERPSVDTVGEKHWIVLGDFFWPEELSKEGEQPDEAAIDPPVVRCSMTIERTATHSRDTVDNCAAFCCELRATKALERKAMRRQTFRNIVADIASPPTARRRRMDHILRVRRAVEAATADFFSRIRQRERAESLQVRPEAYASSRIALLRQSASRLGIYEQILRDYPELAPDSDSADGSPQNVGAGALSPRRNGGRLRLRNMLANSTGRAELQDAIQQDLIDAPALVARAKTVMIDFARMPVQQLRRHRVKLSPNCYVLLLIVFYPGCITVATSISLDAHWYGMLGACILFGIFGVVVNGIAAHHLLRFVCKKRAIRFNAVTHSWSDTNLKAYDKLWEPIHATVRAGEPGTISHHIYLYRIGYFAMLLIKAVVLGLGAADVSASDQLGMLIGVEVIMIFMFAVSLGPFATLIVNIAQPILHGINLVMYAVALAYDPTSCELSEETQSVLTGLGVAGVSLPVLLVVARVIELKIRLCLHQHAVAQAEQLELVAQGGDDRNNDDRDGSPNLDGEVAAVEMVDIVAAIECPPSRDSASDSVVDVEFADAAAAKLVNEVSHPSPRRRPSAAGDFSSSKLQLLISAADMLQSIRDSKAKLADAQMVSFRIELDDAMGHSVMPVRTRTHCIQGSPGRAVPTWPSTFELAALLASKRELKVIRARFDDDLDVRPNIGILTAEANAVDDDVRELSQEVLVGLVRTLNGKHIRIAAASAIESWWRKRGPRE